MNSILFTARSTWWTFVLFLFGCASSSPGLWPPAYDAGSHTILVSVGTGHASIALPAIKHSDENAESRQVYEEWGFAEKAWYLEGRQGSGGILRALFWPTQGVIEIKTYTHVLIERVPQLPGERFTFHITEQGYRQLRHYLESTIGDPVPILTLGPTRLFPSTHSYHVFHQCHQYAARAVRAAGIPITVVLAFDRGSFAHQLNQAKQIEAGAETLIHGKQE